MYMPLKDLGWLVRLNMLSLGIPSEYLKEVRDDTRRLTGESFARITTENMAFALPSGLENVMVPTLVVVGEKEPKRMRQSARELAAALPRAKGYAVAGQGHNWPLKTPALFARTLRAWIESEPIPEGLIPLEAP
jgi:pimeloyl-ACP methyl ester carboxylesterase